MANNENINKVVFGNTTLIDLTSDSVEASNLLEGETAHDRSGAPITGTAKQGHVIKDSDGTSMTQRQNLQFKGATVTDDSVNNRTVVEYHGGGLLPHLVITADSGETVTATKDGTTLTATETSTGIYEVDVTSYGTWTVSDGTNSNTVNVDSVKVYEVAVVSVPDGSTVTPTDDISIWLACGQRTENYTTLAEVLADSTCLSALMADSNAVDYLVRSTTWISGVCADSSAMTYIGLNNYASNTLLADSDWCAGICNSAYFESVLNVKVPTMTSATTPSGTVISSGDYAEQYAKWRAFDGTGNQWSSPSGGTATNKYIGYVFTQSVNVRKITVLGASNDQFTCQAEYKDGDNWKLASENVLNVNGNTNVYILDGVTKTSDSWRLHALTQSGANTTTVVEMQFYGREDV